jgi:hypothetical protein
MSKQYYFDDLVMGSILSFIGTRKRIEQQLTVGVYVILTANMSKWRTTNKIVMCFHRFKISQRIGNRVIISKMKNDEWCKPTIEDIHIVDGIETVKYNLPAVWRWIKPKHKLESLFTKKEWLSLSEKDKIKRFCTEINEDKDEWWLNFI